MIKLYRFGDSDKEYWEAWNNGDGTYTVHWGVLGTKGESKIVRSSFFRRARGKVDKEIDEMAAKGFEEVDMEDHRVLLIEYLIDGMGTSKDLDKRHRLQDRMDEMLGWVGLGNCDGGSIGSGSMEVCNYVVDFEMAKAVIENNLEGTEFGDYSRIYDEDA